MRTRPRRSLVVAIIGTAASLTYAAAASTLFVPDSDTGTLVGILTNGIQQLATLNQQLAEARKTYQETKTLVSYAADATNGFAALATLDFNRLEQAFVSAVPNAAFFDQELRGGYRSWGQSRGELQLMIGQCMNYQQGRFNSAVQDEQFRQQQERQLAQMTPEQRSQWEQDQLRQLYQAAANVNGPRLPSFDPCSLLQQRLTGETVARSLSALFSSGQLPAVAKPALDAAREAERQAARDGVTARKVAALRSLCPAATSTGSDAMAKADECRAAAAAAEILSAQQLVDLTSRMAELSTVAATQLALQVAAQERQRQQDDLQRQILLKAAEQTVQAAPTLTGPGYHAEER